MKRKHSKQLITAMLLITMVLGNTIPVNAEAAGILNTPIVIEAENGVSGNAISESMMTENMVSENMMSTDEGVLDVAAFGEAEAYVGEGYDILFRVNEQWEGAFNGTITITNTTDVVIDNWMIEFDFGHEITNIWDAQIGVRLLPAGGVGCIYS